ncbi:hypothetical protein CTI12_AA414290 [Artemisia annua]|uniref:Uncharacterized protein n=1 Tax=Artemisia annua TaxID=35608 RepID=A0A2U1M6K1_ARTAN|nr:hypothetical protein CTI12_AA414290 [Artemisia annua]
MEVAMEIVIQKRVRKIYLLLLCLIDAWRLVVCTLIHRYQVEFEIDLHDEASIQACPSVLCINAHFKLETFKLNYPIDYKYEGASPAGSQKPNTAVLRHLFASLFGLSCEISDVVPATRYCYWNSGPFERFNRNGRMLAKEVSFVMLDEADWMLDMGFEPEVCSILSQKNSG